MRNHCQEKGRKGANLHEAVGIRWNISPYKSHWWIRWLVPLILIIFIFIPTYFQYRCYPAEPQKHNPEKNFLSEFIFSTFCYQACFLNLCISITLNKGRNRSHILRILGEPTKINLMLPIFSIYVVHAAKFPLKNSCAKNYRQKIGYISWGLGKTCFAKDHNVLTSLYLLSYYKKNPQTDENYKKFFFSIPRVWRDMLILLYNMLILQIIWKECHFCLNISRYSTNKFWFSFIFQQWDGKRDKSSPYKIWW